MKIRSAMGCLLAVLVAGCGRRNDLASSATAHAPAARDTTKAAPGDWCALADSGVEAAIAAAAKARDADEYCEDRHYAIDDVDGDSLDDFIVTFNLEPASRDADTESYLMAFLTTREGRAPLLLRIDNMGAETGARYPTDVSIDGDAAVVDFDNYLPGDPDCCPSRSSTVRFRLTRDSIIEQTRPRERLQRRVGGTPGRVSMLNLPERKDPIIGRGRP